MMQKTKDPYNVVLRLGKKTFLIFKNIYVLYDLESTWWVDDRVKRIDQRIYAGDLIQNRDGMVMKHTAEEDIEEIITDYFGVDPDIVAYAAVNPKLNQNYDNEGRELSTYKMRERYELTQKSWKHDVGNMIDTKIIYQGDNIPIKLPDVSEVEIYDKDYGIFGIHNYESWIPDPTRYNVGEIYHISGEFIVDSRFDEYSKTTDVKVFTPTHNLKDWLPEEILVPKKGFIDEKTFNCIGNDPVELDIFFRIDMIDTDSWYMTVLLITAPMDSYLKKKEHPHIPGNLEGAYNSRTGNETECSIKGGENIEYPASVTIRFDEGPSFLQVRYRPHRGSLEDSIALAKTFDSPSEMFDHIVKEWGGLIDKEDLSIGKEDWGSDPRIDWPNCHYVLTKRCGGTKYDTPQCIGMCCYEGHMLVEDAVVISESAAGIKPGSSINDVDAVINDTEVFPFPIMTGLEGNGYNENLKLIHDAANYWGNKAKEERKEERFGGENDGNES